MKIILEFKNVVKKDEIFDVFQRAFEFTYPPKGFDSLEDSLGSLDTESAVFIKSHGSISVEAKSLRHLKHVLPNEYEVVHKLLQCIAPRV